jgi:hypothetical protein
MCPRPSQTQSEERADTLADERKSQQVGPIYIVRVKLNRTEAVNIPDFSPTPGMQVYIKTSERTFFQYIVKPIRQLDASISGTIGKTIGKEGAR